MHVSTITVFVEWTILITLLLLPRILKAHSCTTVKHQDGILENCSFRGLVIGIPQDLDLHVTEIDFSGNKMKNLVTQQGFDKYKKLRVLLMRNMTKLSPFTKSPYLFKNVYSLEVIDFSYTYAEDGPLDFAWPPNTRIIYVHGNAGLLRLDVDNLKSLEQLYANDITNMENFPIFHDLAKLEVLDLKNNARLRDLSTDTISKLCHLDHLNITINLTLMSYCECRKLRSWTYSYRIKLGSTIHCGTPSPAPKCDLKFTPLQLDRRRTCLARGLSSKTASKWYEIFPLTMIIVLSLLIPSYLYAKKYRMAHHKLHHHKSPKVSANATGNGDTPAEEEESSDDAQGGGGES